MNRRWGAPALVAACVLAVLAGTSGCGVPDSGGPVIDSTPRPVVGVDDGDAPLEPVGPADAHDSKETVRIYFQAASTASASMERQVRRFIWPSARPGLVPSTQITVVRLSHVGNPVIVDPARHRIDVRGEVIGKLTESGALLPAEGEFRHTFRLRFSDKDPRVWLIENPPAGYVLSDTALRTRYEQMTLYFSNHWSTASLVPDARYVPMTLDPGKQRSLLVDWLLQGPSAWLTSVARRGFPNGTKRRGSVYVTKSGVTVVNLTSEADGFERKDWMVAQLLWTLRPRLSGGLQLRIEDRPISLQGRVTHSRKAFQGLNAVAGLPERVDAQAYYVNHDRRVAELPPAKSPPAVLTAAGAEANRAVESAASSRSGDLVAMVRSSGDRRELVVGRLPKPNSDRTPDPAKVKPNFQKVKGLPATGAFSRPVWVGTSARYWLLVAAAGGLYEVKLQHQELRARRLSVPELGPVRAVSVAPDGYRVALVAGGQLHVGELPQRTAGVAVESLRRVTARLSGVVDVTWSHEQQLVAAGRDGLWEVRIDGVELNELPTQTGGAVDHVASYPSLDPQSPGRVLFTQGGRVYEAYSSQAKEPAHLDSPPPGSAPFFAF